MSAVLAIVGFLVVILLFYWSAQSVLGMFFGGPMGDLFGFVGHGLFGLLGALVGFGIAVGAVYAAEAVALDDADVFHALGTTAVAAIVVALVGWIPMVGAALAVFGWLAVLYYRYEESWVDAVVVAGVSWVLAFAVTGVLNLFLGILGAGVRAVGIPGV